MAGLRHAVGAALIAEYPPTRPVRQAIVIRCGMTRLTSTTERITYAGDEDTAAWYADLRARQAVR